MLRAIAERDIPIPEHFNIFLVDREIAARCGEQRRGFVGGAGVRAAAARLCRLALRAEWSSARPALPRGQRRRSGSEGGLTGHDVPALGRRGAAPPASAARCGCSAAAAPLTCARVWHVRACGMWP